MLQAASLELWWRILQRRWGLTEERRGRSHMTSGASGATMVLPAGRRHAAGVDGDGAHWSREKKEDEE